MTILQSFNLMYPNSDNIGEEVNLARSMTNTFDNTYFDVYDNCRDQLYRRDIAGEKWDVFEIFPNPTSGNITILLPSEWKQTSIEIYNLTGSLIEQVNAYDSKKIELNLGLENGIYLCKLHSSDGEIFVKKFIVIK